MRAFLAALALCLAAISIAHGETRLRLATASQAGLPRRSAAQAGIASVYSYGPRTANGERFNPHELTAAHRTLPFGTLVKVCRPLPHNCVVVRINDRGPFVRGRIIDLTPTGAFALGFSGLARVTVEPIR